MRTLKEREVKELLALQSMIASKADCNRAKRRILAYCGPKPLFAERIWLTDDDQRLEISITDNGAWSTFWSVRMYRACERTGLVYMWYRQGWGRSSYPSLIELNQAYNPEPFISSCGSELEASGWECETFIMNIFTKSRGVGYLRNDLIPDISKYIQAYKEYLSYVEPRLSRVRD